MPVVLTLIDTLYAKILEITLQGLSMLRRGFAESPLVSEEVTEHFEPTVPLLVEQKNATQESLATPIKTFTAIKDVIDRVSYAPAMVHSDIQMTHSVLVPDAPVFRAPTIDFDTCVTTMSYGSEVSVREFQGRFCHVAWGTEEGWMLHDDLITDKARVLPHFRVGEAYDVDHPTTARTRSILKDIFGLSRSESPLQAGEYVLYRLWLQGKQIVWPKIRPRTQGMWHIVLRGQPGIHMRMTPVPGALIEYTMQGEIGHVAYVVSVGVDETLELEEANFPDSGIYNERTLTKAEWVDLHPVFIVVDSNTTV